jgi:hypothetical protein
MVDSGSKTVGMTKLVSATAAEVDELSRYYHIEHLNNLYKPTAYDYVTGSIPGETVLETQDHLFDNLADPCLAPSSAQSLTSHLTLGGETPFSEILSVDFQKDKLGAPTSSLALFRSGFKLGGSSQSENDDLSKESGSDIYGLSEGLSPLKIGGSDESSINLHKSFIDINIRIGEARDGKFHDQRDDLKYYHC